MDVNKLSSSVVEFLQPLAETGKAALAPGAGLTVDPARAGTKAEYRVGPPERPPIQHDNGHLQNPTNPNDPNPMPTRPPTMEDRLAYMKWQAALSTLEAVQGKPGIPHNNIPDGLASYRHFLEGSGADRQFSYQRFVDGDPSGKVALNNAGRDMQLAAQDVYSQMVARDPSVVTRPVSFDITGTEIAVGGKDKATGLPSQEFPYPQTENWQKAIGWHPIWLSGHVTVTPDQAGGPPRYDTQMTLHAEDRYNFNRGNFDFATGIPDAENGRFEETGLAKQYMNYSTLNIDLHWQQGSVNAPMVLP